MSGIRLSAVLFGLVLLPIASVAQYANFDQPPGEQVDAQHALGRALKASSLTADGKPFHAVLEIGQVGTPYSGRVEVWWVSATEMKSVVTTSAFSQTRVVNGDQVMETDQGDYFPRWLENFVDALLNPIPTLANFTGLSQTVAIGPQAQSCLRRDDRPGGITDQLTWGLVCFSGAEPHVASVLAMNASLEFADWKGFGKKQIARTYSTNVLDYQKVTAHLATLEELEHPDATLFAVAVPTLGTQQLKTAFVSTLKEESLLDKAPVIEWPTVREGKTDGYMIVYARTDRTGQVRETAKHNSDQPGLESFGMQVALKYKFKPLIVDGVAVQMEMPLVLHFSSKIADPIPVLNDAEMRTHISGCELPRAVAGQPPMRVRVSVNEAGKYTGIKFMDANNPNNPHPAQTFFAFQRCTFSPLVVNGVATYYHGDLLLP